VVLWHSERIRPILSVLETSAFYYERVRVILASLLVASFAAFQGVDEPVDFLRDVRPIFAEKCLICHGPDEQKANLRLDTHEGIMGDLGGYFAVVPGDLDESEMWWRVAEAGEEDRMPPHDSGKSLSEKEVDILRRWIQSGAEWREHWGFAPLSATPAPRVKNEGWVRDPLDIHVLAKFEAEGEFPPKDAPDTVWLRRVFFDLTGLPPRPEDRESFLAEPAEGRRAWMVDNLLESRHFGERWARHWLDLVRYASTRGHEFDFAIPNAWEYRDWLIRAFNQDVPWDRMVREQVAGDLLDPPRLHPEEQWNESVLGTGFWLLGEEVHSPVDLEKDLADRTANKLDVFGKSILGMTLACARCHDHKFDPVPTRDYYALSGLVQSASYRQVRFQSLEWNKKIRVALDALERQEGPMAQKDAQERILGAQEAPGPSEVSLGPSGTGGFDSETLVWLAGRDPWWQDGSAFSLRSSGEALFTADVAWPIHHFLPLDAVILDPDWMGLKAAQVSGGPHVEVNWRGEGRTFRTQTRVLGHGSFWYLVRGKGVAFAPVEHHRIVHGPLHKIVQKFDTGADWKWVEHAAMGAYPGMRTHVEFSPQGDGNWIGVAAISQGNEPPFPAPTHGKLDSLLTEPRPLGKPSNSASSFHEKRKRLLGQRILESRIAPALLDGNGVDQALLYRGQPSQPRELVPRSFLSRFSPEGGLAPSRREDGRLASGRLFFADALFQDSGPLVARVFVNRIWHHLFGQGIVKTTDNFGTLGSFPSHPALLDHLASSFIEEGWSLKALVRRIVLSRTYGMEREPRRLEAEAIRDSILSVSGRLDRKVGGPPVPVHLTSFMKGRGRPAESGPLDGAGRRSIYLEVRRNFLIPFLLVWDFPQPATSMGRRSISNVPAQALALMNSPFVRQQAEVWAEGLQASSPDDSSRIRTAWLEAFGRFPSSEEEDSCASFLLDPENGGWEDLCHALFNVKEFVHVP
jgi:hypothetical protein